MALLTLHDLLAEIQRDPFAFLTARRLRALSTYLSARDLALQELGLEGWSDLPIGEIIEKEYGVEMTPWRGWVEIVESFERDEWAAFERFFEHALRWPSSAVKAPVVSAHATPSLSALLDRIAARPAMYLGEVSLERLANFVRGYVDTTRAAGHAAADIDAFERFCHGLPSALETPASVPWWRAFGFLGSTDSHAFEAFLTKWNEQSARIE